MPCINDVEFASVVIEIVDVKIVGEWQHSTYEELVAIVLLW